MNPTDRCDEIIALIDRVLGETAEATPAAAPIRQRSGRAAHPPQLPHRSLT
jgi:hypothetical protein